MSKRIFTNFDFGLNLHEFENPKSKFRAGFEIMLHHTLGETYIFLILNVLM